MTLGAMIYKLRTEKNMSQGDLADTLNVSRQSVSKWENDSSVPDLDKLKKLSQLFGISLDELVNGEPRPEPQAQTQTIIYATAEKQPMPGHTLAGTILLICAAVVFITFSILGYLSGNPLLGLLAAIPLALNGTVCMLCKKNTGFLCCWLNFGIAWVIQFFFAINALSGTATVVPLLFLILALALTAWSLKKLWKGHFSCKKAFLGLQTQKKGCTLSW